MIEMAYSLNVQIIKNWVNDTQLKIEENRVLENMSCLETGEVCVIYGQVFFGCFSSTSNLLEKEKNISIQQKALQFVSWSQASKHQ